jgi:SAM-dependent methyltransferase
VAQSTEDLAADFPANPAQAEYWNTVMADKWVAHQAAIDVRFASLTDYLVTRSGAALGERVIDVGCGTGASLLALAERVTPDGSVLGIDFSRSMLALAEQRVRAAGHAHVALRLVDAQTHVFDAQAFDLLVSRFGVMFFSDPVAAFRNLLGALRPDGRLAFVCWTDLPANPWFALPLEAGIRHLGEPEPAPPRAPGPFAFAEADHVDEVLRNAGFVDIAIERTESVIEGAPSARDEAAFASQMGPVSRLIRERAPDDEAVVARIAGDVTEHFRRFETAAGVRLPATVFFVTAKVADAG